MSHANDYNWFCRANGGIFNAALPRLTLRMMALAGLRVVRDVAVNGAFEFWHTFENAAANAPGGDLSEPAFDEIQPR